MRNNERAPPVGCEENNQQGNQQTDVVGIEQQERRTMIRCNVTVCGVVSRVATCRTNKDGQPFVTFAMNVVIPAKSGINKTIEVSVLKDGTLTATEDCIVGQMEFRGKVGKNIEEKQSKKGEPYLMFSAFSAEKVQDGFEYLWVRFVRFGKEREAWLVPGCKVTAKGEMELSVYNDRLSFSCKVDEMAEYVPQPYNPQN